MVYIDTPLSDNLTSAGNQQGSLPFIWDDPSETTRRAPHQELKAYLLGALHDGTYNQKHKTFRITQANVTWLQRLQRMLELLGFRSWIYREGKERNVYALETTAKFLDLRFDPVLLRSSREQLAYVRGYFDAEGGIPRSNAAPFYIQLCQKNHDELCKVQAILEHHGIRCGKIHNPSKRIDPDYWRFFVSAKSHQDFCTYVSSWHPRKEKLLKERKMI